MARTGRGAGLILLIAFVLSLGTASRVFPITAGTLTATRIALPYRISTPQASVRMESIALNLVNRERVASGISPLVPHLTIRSAARAHGVEMFTLGYLSHRSRDGRWPNDRVRALGVRARVIGENLAYAQSVYEAHQALIASSAHRANMLSRQYRRLGVGVIDGGAYGVIVVQNFSD